MEGQKEILEDNHRGVLVGPLLYNVSTRN